MNIRPATHEDDAFLREMLYEAAAWNPDWPRERMIAALADPMLERYHRDWGREGDAGVIAELDREPVGSAWYRLFTAEQPGYGFVDEKTPELGLAVVPLHRRKGIGHTLLRALMVQARRGRVPGALALGSRAQPVADDVRASGVRTRSRGGRGRVLGDAGRARLSRLGPRRSPPVLVRAFDDARGAPVPGSRDTSRLLPADLTDPVPDEPRDRERERDGDRPRERADDRLGPVPALAEERTDPREGQDPGEAAEHRVDGEPPDVHPDDASGEADERSDHGQEPAEEHRGLAAPLEPLVGTVDLVRAYQQVSAPAVDQRPPTRVAGPVREPRPHEVAERPREHDQPELELLLRREERGGRPAPRRTAS